jgi:hypothetical protein
VDGKICPPPARLVSFTELARSIERIHDPHAICLQPRAIICGLFGQDRIVRECRA